MIKGSKISKEDYQKLYKEWGSFIRFSCEDAYHLVYGDSIQIDYSEEKTTGTVYRYLLDDEYRKEELFKKTNDILEEVAKKKNMVWNDSLKAIFEKEIYEELDRIYDGFEEC